MDLGKTPEIHHEMPAEAPSSGDDISNQAHAPEMSDTPLLGSPTEGDALDMTAPAERGSTRNKEMAIESGGAIALDQTTELDPSPVDESSHPNHAGTDKTDPEETETTGVSLKIETLEPGTMHEDTGEYPPTTDEMRQEVIEGLWRTGHRRVALSGSEYWSPHMRTKTLEVVDMYNELPRGAVHYIEPGGWALDTPYPIQPLPANDTERHEAWTMSSRSYEALSGVGTVETRTLGKMEGEASPKTVDAGASDPKDAVATTYGIHTYKLTNTGDSAFVVYEYNPVWPWG